jgi:Ni/Co efflux regulator RcnB
MRKIAIAFAALATIGFLAPTMQSARAETLVIKKDIHRDRDRDRDWRRHHHKKVIIIKHRDERRDHDHDHD